MQLLKIGYLNRMIFHRIYSGLIRHHLVALVFSTKTGSSPHGLNPKCRKSRLCYQLMFVLLSTYKNV